MVSKFAILIPFLLVLKYVSNSPSALANDVTEKRVQKLFLDLETNREKIDSALKSVNRESRRIQSPVLFSAYLGRTYYPMSPNQVIPFETTQSNIGGGYDPYFGLFRAPVSGFYQFVLTSQASTNSYMVDLEMVKNGNMICRAHAATYGQQGYCAAMVHLNKDDDVWVRHYNDIGTYLYAGYRPSFSGYLIKAD